MQKHEPKPRYPQPLHSLQWAAHHQSLSSHSSYHFLTPLLRSGHLFSSPLIESNRRSRKPSEAPGRLRKLPEAFGSSRKRIVWQVCARKSAEGAGSFTKPTVIHHSITPRLHHSTPLPSPSLLAHCPQSEAFGNLRKPASNPKNSPKPQSISFK